MNLSEMEQTWRGSSLAVPGEPAVEPPNNSTWRSSAPAGTTEHMLSAAVTRRGRAAGALCGAGARKQR
ncbi:hypothetical protein EMIHUDRAFT_367024 [Emiliania huxleyi CCMP1516]|uniref:Uncharacterized protein n=2 Tax=Emiliania huxleyi TaxID=2903 RepID=A0A0D3JRS5_EMIH1|nr:hypothetical protein EMIHUDRAFT_367024 [Emiliania huxleyi CCMP1516]EOD26210.1 hypothetical protein EMIHUDRAFT_367024 [Emiliania huxleyi CCMP1516]|eukprot:XP_005778639.1 hypothetical protein EMIHUDRAFT_367024 [Emiliania huxleyi CCMP1516]